jgi:hypothetical protein
MTMKFYWSNGAELTISPKARLGVWSDVEELCELYGEIPVRVEIELPQEDWDDRAWAWRAWLELRDMAQRGPAR